MMDPVPASARLCGAQSAAANLIRRRPGRNTSQWHWRPLASRNKAHAALSPLLSQMPMEKTSLSIRNRKSCRRMRLGAAAESSGSASEDSSLPGPLDLPPWDPGLRTSLSDEHTVGGVCVRVGTEVRIPGYAMSVAKVAAKQLHMHKAEAKLNSVIRYFAKTTEPSDAIEEMVERASKGPFKAMYMRDYRLLVESLLSEESVKALGDLDWENSTEPTQLRQLMIDAVLQWAENEEIYKPAFATIDTPPDPNVLTATVRDPNMVTAGGETITRALTIRVEGPSVAVLRDKAGLPGFLDDVAAGGDPYKGLQPHQILEFAPFKTFGLVNPLLAMEEFGLCLSSDMGVLLSGSPAELGDGQEVHLHCSGGSELYQNLVLGVAEYVEDGIHSGENNTESRWVPSSATLGFARLPKEVENGGRCHALRFAPEVNDGTDNGQAEEACHEEMILSLDDRELGSLGDTVDFLLCQYPREMALSPPAPSTINETPSMQGSPKGLIGAAQAAFVVLIAAGGAVLLGRRYGTLPGTLMTEATPRGAASVATSCVRNDEVETPSHRVHLLPGNDDLSEEQLQKLCTDIERELYSRVLPIAHPAWEHAGEILLEYQVVVSFEGKVLGCRPVNGFGAHFYGPLKLANYQTCLEDIEKRSKPVVLKASISNRIAKGVVDPDVEVRCWSDSDSLLFWGFLPASSSLPYDVRIPSSRISSTGDSSWR